MRYRIEVHVFSGTCSYKMRNVKRCNEEMKKNKTKTFNLVSQTFDESREKPKSTYFAASFFFYLSITIRNVTLMLTFLLRPQLITYAKTNITKV